MDLKMTVSMKMVLEGTYGAVSRVYMLDDRV